MTKRKSDEEIAPCLYLRMSLAAKRLLKLYEAHLAESGMSMSQFGLLIAVAEEPGLTMSRLAEKRGLSPSTLSRTLRPLEAQALVETRADAENRRVRRARLTREGRARLRVAYAGWKQAQAKASALVSPKLVAHLLGATAALA